MISGFRRSVDPALRLFDVAFTHPKKRAVEDFSPLIEESTSRQGQEGDARRVENRVIKV